MARQQPRARRVPGTGTVFETTRRGRAVWVARMPTGTAPSGRTSYREASAPTAAAALAKLAALKPLSGGTTVSEWCDRWLAEIRVRPSTLDNYKRVVTHYVKPVLGRVALRDLTTYEVERAAALWGAKREPGTVRTALGVLRSCLAAAARSGAIPSNPATLARRPRVARKSILPFTRAELLAVVAEAGAYYLTRVVAALAAGLRLGEAVALDVADYDAATGVLSVTKTCHPVHGIGPAKTASSVRAVRVPEPFRPAIAAAAGGRSKGPLFRSAAGTRLGRMRVAGAWGKLLDKLGLARRNLHQLRHTSITLQLAAGFAPADVAKYHGNSVAVVISTYCHPTQADPSRALDGGL